MKSVICGFRLGLVCKRLNNFRSVKNLIVKAIKMGCSCDCEDVLKMIESHNKQLSAQIERKARRAPQLQYIMGIQERIIENF